MTYPTEQFPSSKTESFVWHCRFKKINCKDFDLLALFGPRRNRSDFLCVLFEKEKISILVLTKDFFPSITINTNYRVSLNLNFS